jgi:2-alkenal reductase
MVARRSVLSRIGLLGVLALLCACAPLAALAPTATPAPTAVSMPAATLAPTAMPMPTATVAPTATLPPTATTVPTQPPAASPTRPVVLAGGADDEQALIALYEKVSPSVVFIAVETSAGLVSGSGFIIDTEGHIVTNNHVVEGALQIVVDFYDDSETSAHVIGTDLYSDLVVIQVKALPPGAVPVTFGDSEAVLVGQTAIAIGNPFGREFALTMTTGVISAKARSLPAGDITGLGPSYQNPEILQTDAAINPGNSGGPLFDLAGEVIGVNAAIESQSGTSSGVGFAIPVNAVKRVVPELIRSGRYPHPYIGITAESVTMVPSPEEPDLLVEAGTRVASVTADGPASQGGLQEGDLITAIDGTSVHDFNDLISYLEANTHPGDVIELTVVRNSVDQMVSIELGERP